MAFLPALTGRLSHIAMAGSSEALKPRNVENV